MKVGILVTNGGTHSPEKWAAESAAQLVDIIQINENSIVFESMTKAKTELEKSIENILVLHHDTVKAHEITAIDEQGFDRLGHTLDPEADHLEAAVSDVQIAADNTMFGTHFRKPEVEKFIRSTLGSHFATVRQIERSTHADKHLHEPKAKAFRAQFHS